MAPVALSAPLASAVLGSALHISALGLRLDNHGWHIFTVSTLALLLSLLAVSLNSGLLVAVCHVLPAAACFLLGFFGSTATYRLLFSPIRRFPGPWQAALSSFYRVHLATRSGVQLFSEIDALHKKYGDFVRTGPRELSVLNPAAIPILYGAKAQCKRGPWYDHDGVDVSEDRQLFLIRDPAVHSWRRRIMDRGFSSKALANYEPRVQSTVDTLMKAFDRRVGEPIDINEWIGFFAFDAMGRVAYSLDFGMLERGVGTVEVDGKSTSVAALHATTRVFGILGCVPWLIKMFIKTGFVGELAAFHQWCHDTMKSKQKTFHSEADAPTDISSALLSAHQSASSGASRRQTQASLENDSVLLIMAGSDTTASAIANALFYLTRDRPRFRKLQKLLDEQAPDRSARVLASVPYLDAVVNETLRLKPPVCEGATRETPAGGITVAGTHIPGGTIVSVPSVPLHRDPRFWGPDAHEFRPERWLEEDEGGALDLRREDVPFMPFSRGAYTCPGKQLAYMEMRAVVAAVVARFAIEFAEGQDPRAFDEGGVDSFTLTNPPLRVVLTRREG